MLPVQGYGRPWRRIVSFRYFMYGSADKGPWKRPWVTCHAGAALSGKIEGYVLPYFRSQSCRPGKHEQFVAFFRPRECRTDDGLD